MARVMIVDDAEFMRMVIRNILIIHGHEVVAEVRTRHKIIQLIHHILWFECVIPFSVKLITYNI